MTRIEILNLADNGQILAAEVTNSVISVHLSDTFSTITFGPGSDGRTFVVIPSHLWTIHDVTVNEPRDLVIVHVEPVPVHIRQ